MYLYEETCLLIIDIRIISECIVISCLCKVYRNYITFSCNVYRNVYVQNIYLYIYLYKDTCIHSIDIRIIWCVFILYVYVHRNYIAGLCKVYRYMYVRCTYFYAGRSIGSKDISIVVISKDVSIIVKI